MLVSRNKMRKFVDYSNIYPCCYLYGDTPQVLKEKRVRLDDVRNILREYINVLKETKTLTYSDRVSDTKIYEEVLTRPDQKISQAGYLKYLGKDELYSGDLSISIAVTIMMALLWMFTVSFSFAMGSHLFVLPVTMLLALFITLSIRLNRQFLKYEKKKLTAIAANILVIHALEMKQDEKLCPLTTTRYKVINYKI